jgi:HPt (histidine-containing phosphotransfer) domain-containing protein
MLFVTKGVSVETKQLDSCLDIELLQGYLDSLGKAIVEQMFSLYCQQVAIYLKDIEKAQKNNSPSEWQEHCHKMKGASASVGMCDLHGLLKELEHTEATQQKKSLLLEELKQTNNKAMDKFSSWLETK